MTAGDTRLGSANVSEQTDEKHVWNFLICDAVDVIVNDGGRGLFSHQKTIAVKALPVSSSLIDS